MPEANSPFKLKETVPEWVKENESQRGRQRKPGGFILLKVTAESQPDCLLFLRRGHGYVGRVLDSLQAPAA